MSVTLLQRRAPRHNPRTRLSREDHAKESWRLEGWSSHRRTTETTKAGKEPQIPKANPSPHIHSPTGSPQFRNPSGTVRPAPPVQLCHCSSTPGRRNSSMLHLSRNVRLPPLILLLRYNADQRQQQDGLPFSAEEPQPLQPNPDPRTQTSLFRTAGPSDFIYTRINLVWLREERHPHAHGSTARLKGHHQRASECIEVSLEATVVTKKQTKFTHGLPKDKT